MLMFVLLIEKCFSLLEMLRHHFQNTFPELPDIIIYLVHCVWCIWKGSKNVFNRIIILTNAFKGIVHSNMKLHQFYYHYVYGEF